MVKLSKESDIIIDEYYEATTDIDNIVIELQSMGEYSNDNELELPESHVPKWNGLVEKLREGAKRLSDLSEKLETLRL